MTKFKIVFLCILILFVYGLTIAEIDQQKIWPKRVLITNDNGIDDIKIIELARAFAQVSETYVVAPLTDQSGTSNHSGVGEKRPFIEVEKRNLGPGIIAYGVDGYPADCVMFAGLGLLKNNLPDLVVSGINGGPNLGFEWFGSGTIGAARTAALGGLPAIAVSGLDQRIPGSVKAACQWVVQLAQSPVVKNLRAGQYLTISIPRVAPDQIRGIKVVCRAKMALNVLPTMVPDKHIDPASKRERWILGPPDQSPVPTDDIKAYMENYISIVPMNVDEVDYRKISELEKNINSIPRWPNKPG